MKTLRTVEDLKKAKPGTYAVKGKAAKELLRQFCVKLRHKEKQKALKLCHKVG